MLFDCIRDSVVRDRERLGGLLVSLVVGQTIDTRDIPELARRIAVAYELLEDSQAYSQQHLDNKYAPLMDLLVEGGCV